MKDPEKYSVKLKKIDEYRRTLKVNEGNSEILKDIEKTGDTERN
jgi:hypothetical protein